MFCAFVTFVVTIGGLGALAWLGLRRIAAHVRRKPEALQNIVADVLLPLFGKEADGKEQPAGDEAKPEVKRVKGTLL